MFTSKFIPLTVTNLTVFLSSTRPLIKNLSFTINQKDKIAIIGEEGNGKSTLLKIIANASLPDNIHYQGQINHHSNRFGYLPQVIPTDQLSLHILPFLISDSSTKITDWSLLNNYHHLNQCLQQVGLPADIIELEKPLSGFSGGEQIKIYLAKILIGQPDLLILDEPTNNLDLNTICWLEKLIKSSLLPIIYVSHDIKLLQKTATHILHLEQITNKQQSRHTFIKSNYTDYTHNRQQKIIWETKESARQKRQYQSTLSKLLSIKNNVVRDQNRIIDSSARRLLNKRMKTILSQQKKLEKKALLPQPDIEESINLNFSLNTKPNPQQIIVQLSLPILKIKQKTLLKNIDLQILGTDKICFIGPNGSGKSTLLKTIYQQILQTGKKVGYFPQTLSSFFDLPNHDSIRYVMHYNSKHNETTTRQLLGQLKFTSEEMASQPHQLSGGQQTKLILLCLAVGNFSILILDEPTRNLSPLSSPVLFSSLRKYPGCIISASHDRTYIEQVANKIYHFHNQTLSRTP